MSDSIEGLGINVKACGAVGDGSTLDTAAIQTAIEKIKEAGGGVVYFPPGHYLSGTIHLCDDLEIRINIGATIIATKDVTQFDPPDKILYPNGQGSESINFNHSLF